MRAAVGQVSPRKGLKTVCTLLALQSAPASLVHTQPVTLPTSLFPSSTEPKEVRAEGLLPRFCSAWYGYRERAVPAYDLAVRGWARGQASVCESSWLEVRREVVEEQRGRRAVVGLYWPNPLNVSRQSE